MDHWVGADNANQLRRADIPEDLIIETRVNFLGSGPDPDNPVWPPPNEAYGAFLMVDFSQFDCYYFGLYRGTAIWLERSGQNGLCIVDPGLQELSLQVVKRARSTPSATGQPTTTTGPSSARAPPWRPRSRWGTCSRPGARTSPRRRSPMTTSASRRSRRRPPRSSSPVLSAIRTGPGSTCRTCGP